MVRGPPTAKHILFSSARLGFRDESPLYDASPQPYAELFIMNADGTERKRSISHTLS